MRIRLPLFLLCVCSAAAQTPTVTGVSNGLSFAPSLSPGVLAAVFGTNFGTDKSVLTSSVGGKPAPVLQATASQLLVQIPIELQAGPTSITVSKSGATSAPLNITLAAYAPALATVSGSDALVNGASGTVATVRAGDNVTVYAAGLGATNPPVATGVAASGISNCVTTPQLTLAGISITPGFCGLAPGQIGLYQLNIKIPANVAPGQQPLVLTIGTASSPAVNVTVTGAPVISSVVNAASQDKAAPIAPGSMVTVIGAGFGGKDQLTGFPGTGFQGVSVSMNGILAPVVTLLASASPPQITVMAPIELPQQGTVPVTVTTADGVSAALQVNMTAASPGIFRTGYKNYGVVTLANASFGDPAAAPGLGISASCGTAGALAASNCGRALKSGDLIQIHATGLGAATPSGDPNASPLATGQLTPADGSLLYLTLLPLTVTVGSVPAQVTFSGIVPGLAGEYQVNVTIPDGVAAADDVPLTLTVNGLSDTVSIALASN